MRKQGILINREIEDGIFENVVDEAVRLISKVEPDCRVVGR